MVSFLQAIDNLMKAVVDKPGFIALAAALVKPEQRRCAEERAEFEERYSKIVEAGM